MNCSFSAEEEEESPIAGLCICICHITIVASLAALGVLINLCERHSSNAVFRCFERNGLFCPIDPVAGSRAGGGYVLAVYPADVRYDTVTGLLKGSLLLYGVIQQRRFGNVTHSASGELIFAAV